MRDISITDKNFAYLWQIIIILLGLEIRIQGYRVPYYPWDDNRCRQIEPEGEYGCYVMQNQTYYDESGNCSDFIRKPELDPWYYFTMDGSPYEGGYNNPGFDRPDCPAFAWETCENDPALDLDIIAWDDCPSDEFELEFEDPPPIYIETTEDDLLARFNELSDAELEAAFGEPLSAALNGYVTRVRSICP